MRKVGNALLQLMEDLSQASTNGKATVKVNRNLAKPEEFKRLFDYFSKGTVLERVDLKVETMETRMSCVCGNREVINDDNHNGYGECSECGRIADIDDSEYTLVEPDPDIVQPRRKIKF